MGKKVGAFYSFARSKSSVSVWSYAWARMPICHFNLHHHSSDESASAIQSGKQICLIVLLMRVLRAAKEWLMRSGSSII